MKVSVLGLALLLAPLASAQTEALPPGDDEAHWAAVEQQREREIGLLQGKKITQIDIVGLNEEQRKNAEIFLQLGRIKGETIGGGGVNAEYAQYLLEQGPTQIGQSQQPFGYYNSRVHYELLPGKNGELTVRYRGELGPPVRLQNVQVAVAGAAEGETLGSGSEGTGKQLIVRVPPRTAPDRGGVVHVRIRKGQQHNFSAATGDRLPE